MFRGLLAWAVYVVAYLFDAGMRWSFDDTGWRWQMFRFGQWLLSTSSKVQGETDYWGPWKNVSEKQLEETLERD